MHEVDGRDPKQVQEYVAHFWYEYAGGDEQGLHPWEGETNLKYTGPKPPYEHLDVEGKYSWLKTPRWKNQPMEVGPLARMLVAYASGSGEVKEVVDGALKALDVPVTALFSTLGRTAARGLETKLIARWAKEFYAQLLSNIKNGDTRMFDGSRWEPADLARRGEGRGHERGAARGPGPLDRDQGSQDRKLPACGADDLERLAARQPGPDVLVRGRADRHAGGQSRAAAGDFCARSTRSTPVWRAPCICTTRAAATFTRSRSIRRARMNTVPIQRIYVWELPVRFYHWINAASVVVLAMTGYLIGNPPAIQSAAEAYDSYWFGTVRFLPLRRRLRVLLQLPVPPLLGLRRQPLRPLGQLHPGAAGQVAGGGRRAEGRYSPGAARNRWIRSATTRWPA